MHTLPGHDPLNLMTCTSLQRLLSLCVWVICGTTICSKRALQKLYRKLNI